MEQQIYKNQGYEVICSSQYTLDIEDAIVNYEDYHLNLLF